MKNQSTIIILLFCIIATAILVESRYVESEDLIEAFKEVCIK
jgi:hypothetical protein